MSITKHETYLGAQGHRIFIQTWCPQNARALVIISHGMGEHGGRYTEVATTFARAGFTVVVPDQRGHGRSLLSSEAGDMGYDGWNQTIRDLYRVSRWAHKSCGNLPQILLGHSMGAMLAQQYIYLFGFTLHGCMLSGSLGFLPTWPAVAGEFFAGFEAWRTDPAKHSARLQAALFDRNNKRYEGTTSNGFEWLSRDMERVQSYVEDPLCGSVLASGSLQGMFRGVRRAADKANLATIPKSLPIYVFSGSDDPVHNQMRNLQRMIDAYVGTGLAVSTQIYPGGRHESFNEVNRDEVITDCLDWMRKLGEPNIED